MDLSLNRRAASLADRMEEEAKLLHIAVRRLGNGTRVIDCGVEVEGGLDAGRRLAEVCLASLATVRLTSADVTGLGLPAVEVVTDHPVIACLASQYAGWLIDPSGYTAMGSGPARTLARVERELYGKIRYAESCDRAVLVLESRALPDERVAAFVAERCGLPPGALTLLVAPTASMAGAVQVAARAVETGMHKMLELGFDVAKVRSGLGVSPVAPVAANDVRAIGWTNDCLLYGGRAYFAVHATDQEIETLIEQLPAVASPDYGRPFEELFNRYGGDFYKIDPLLFSPARVTINNLATGRVLSAGRLNPEVLRASLGLP